MFTKVKRLVALIATFAVLSVSTLYPSVYAASLKNVTVIDEGTVTSYATDAKTVSEFFEEKEIVINSSDIADTDYSAEIKNEMIIEIKRAKPIYIPSTGKIIISAEDYTKEFLTKHGFAVPENEFHVAEAYDKKKDAYILSVIECVTKTETVTESIDNDTIYIEDKSMSANSSKVITKGQKGTAEKTYIIRYENGIEVSRILSQEVVIEKPIDKILKVGTKPVKTKKTANDIALEPSPVVGTQNVTGSTITTSTGKVLNYSRSFNVTATAYDLSYESCGKTPDHPAYGITASGMKAGYGVIAVDPRVIPLGTKLYIASPDGSFTYGEAVAGDTGGAIKGNKIDLFFPTRSECMNFGRRTMTVYILV